MSRWSWGQAGNEKEGGGLGWTGDLCPADLDLQLLRVLIFQEKLDIVLFTDQLYMFGQQRETF